VSFDDVYDWNEEVEVNVVLSLPSNKSAFAAGITLSQLSPMLPSLEETFFEMTGDSE
jgi:hypothetical protein